MDVERARRRTGSVRSGGVVVRWCGAVRCGVVRCSAVSVVWALDEDRWCRFSSRGQARLSGSSSGGGAGDGHLTAQEPSKSQRSILQHPAPTTESGTDATSRGRGTAGDVRLGGAPVQLLRLASSGGRAGLEAEFERIPQSRPRPKSLICRASGPAVADALAKDGDQPGTAL